MLLEDTEPKDEGQSSSLVSFRRDCHLYLHLVEDLTFHHFVSLMWLHLSRVSHAIIQFWFLTLFSVVYIFPQSHFVPSCMQ